MIAIVDCNRIFSALLTKGRVFDVFFLNKSLQKIKFIAPELLFAEIGRNFGEIVERSKLSSEELSKVFTLMKEQIELIPFEEFGEFAEEAKKISPHNKDVKYFALALAFKKYSDSGIWSDEKAFHNQNKVAIFSTEKLMDFLRE